MTYKGYTLHRDLRTVRVILRGECIMQKPTIGEAMRFVDAYRDGRIWAVEEALRFRQAREPDLYHAHPAVRSMHGLD
jgi:hypothetical protein